MEVKKTVCNRDCPDACSILATVENGKITRLAGDPEHPITRGFLCYRTNHFLPLQYDPQRITTPLLRGSDGSFQPISWDSALDLIAERLTTFRRESGPASIFHYRSGGSLGVLKHLVDYFFERFGPVTVKRGDICSGAGDAAQTTDFGEEDSNDLFDLLHARNILLWGKNVFVSSPHTIPVLKDAARQGAQLVLIDPVHHRTAELCNAYHPVRPGGDLALAMGIAHVLFTQNLVHPTAASRCDNLDAFRALALSRSLDAWCAEADLPTSVAIDLAHRLASDGPTAILVGWGMGRRRNGSAIVRALDALCAITGNLGRKGGGVSFYFKRRGAYDTTFIRGADIAPRTLCEPLFGEEILRAIDPPIRAVWITAGNPVVMLPDSNTVAEALRTREFVVVVDSWMSDTAALAHLVLPTTTLLEADDLLGSYGHHYLGVANPVVPPPNGVLSDLEIVQALAARVGLTDALAGTAREWKERIIQPRLAPHGLTLSTLENAAQRNPLAAEVLYASGTVPTATGRVNLMTEITATPAALDVVPDYPLSLMALSTDGSQSSVWSRPIEGPLPVTVHPNASQGIAHNAVAWLESRVGRMQVRVRHDAKQRADVALVPKGGHLRKGQCANALIRAAVADQGEGGALYDERVRLVPIT